MTYDSEETTELYEDLLKDAIENPPAQKGEKRTRKKAAYQFLVDSVDPVNFGSLELPVYLGNIYSEEYLKKSDNPIIMITTTYDSLAISP